MQVIGIKQVCVLLHIQDCICRRRYELYILLKSQHRLYTIILRHEDTFLRQELSTIRHHIVRQHLLNKSSNLFIYSINSSCIHLFPGINIHMMFSKLSPYCQELHLSIKVLESTYEISPICIMLIPGCYSHPTRSLNPYI